LEQNCGTAAGGTESDDIYMLVNELQASFPDINMDKKLPNGHFKNLISAVGKGLQIKDLEEKVH